VAGTAGDAYEVVIDAVWLDVYGTEKGRPPEVTGLRVSKRTDGGLDLTFDELSGASRYSVYFGRLSTLREDGRYDHGEDAPSGPVCDVGTEPAGSGRRQASLDPSEVPAVSSYLLVTGHVDGVESPTGYRSDGTERDRSKNVCP
jgi:hypothetical protein